MNDTAQRVNVVLDAALVGKSELLFHPLINEASVKLSWDDLIKFLTAVGHSYQIMDFAA